jgi:hypothetical protein
MGIDPLAFLDATEDAGSSSDPLEFLGKDVSRAQSLASAPVKGLIKGAARFSPLPNFGPISNKLGERITEQMLPTREGGLEDVLEFAGENAPAAAMGPGGIVRKGAQALAGGLAKKGAKELNLPEWAQDIVGAAGMVGPDAIKAGASKALRPASKQAKIVDFLKGHGLSEKDIVPIIQDKKKLSFLSKAANKFEKQDPWLRGIKEKLGGIFEGIREKGSKGKFLEKEALFKFEDDLQDQLQKVPRMYRGLIKKEVEDLMNNPINFTELHDFNKAINAIVRDVEGGKAAIGILKEPIEKAQKALNPELYGELKSVNEVYSKLYNFTDKMTKKNWDALLSFGQAGGALMGALTLNPALLKTAGIAAAGRYTAKKLLSSPRLQNIHLKMWDAVLNNKIPQALKLMELFEKEDQQSSPSK